MKQTPQVLIKKRRWQSVIVASLVVLGMGSWLKGVSLQPALATSLPEAQTLATFAPSPSIAQSLARPSMNALNPQLADANTRFGFKLFSAIQGQQRDRNVFISPASIAFALGMAYNGANGTTQQAMAKALEVQGMSLDELNRSNATLKNLLEQADPNVQLAIANSLWARQDVSFQPAFLQNNQQFYRAKVTELDFRDPQTLKTINHWVSQSTHGKINQIIDQIDPNAVMFLINAIYFKGDWNRKFDPKQTTQAPFYLADGSSKQHPLMAQQGNYRYTETNQFQAISLPYGNGRRLSMVIVLPKPGTSLTELYSTLTAERWNQWMSQLRDRPGAIQIPRFKLDYDIELSDILSQLGMAEAFSGHADFSKLSQVPTQISEVKHKTVVEVNETGTEAAAVTSIGIRATAAILPQEPFNLIVDRPFFCAIRDNQTGTVLFMGSIVNPHE